MSLRQHAYPPAVASGFTLIEVLIALSLAAVISVALAMALRLGLRFVERGQVFYADLQDTQVVIKLLTRELVASASGKIEGDAGNLLLIDQKFAYRCRADGDDLVLERYVIQASKPDETPVIDAEPLLQHLKVCRFAFLNAPAKADAAKADTGKVGDQTAAQPGETSKAIWADNPAEKMPVLAVRFTLSSREQEWPPLVMLTKSGA